MPQATAVLDLGWRPDIGVVGLRSGKLDKFIVIPRV